MYFSVKKIDGYPGTPRGWPNIRHPAFSLAGYSAKSVYVNPRKNTNNFCCSEGSLCLFSTMTGTVVLTNKKSYDV